MKEFVGHFIAGNFYKYSVYKVTDAKNMVLYIAEPVGMGGTRVSLSQADLFVQLQKDARYMNKYCGR